MIIGIDSNKFIVFKLNTHEHQLDLNMPDLLLLYVISNTLLFMPIKSYFPLDAKDMVVISSEEAEKDVN